MEESALALPDSVASPPSPATESPQSVVVYDLSQRAQSLLESLLKMSGGIHLACCGVIEEIEQCKEFAAERKKSLDGEREYVQRGAYSALQMLKAEEFI